MPEIQTTFVDVTSIVPASWFNRLQKHLAGFLNLKVTINGTAVEVVGAASDGVASAYIGGQMRRNEATVSVTIAGGADTYNVYAVATAAVDTFALEFSATTPATSPYRKIAEVDWDGAAITDLRGVRGRVIDHAHDGYEQPAVSHSEITGLATGDPHTQYLEADGTDDFTGTVGGIYPTDSAHLATKEYADDLLTNVPVGGIFYWPTADAAPTGFLLADGSAVSRTTYSALFAKIGEAYGVGDGSTTFNLPDMRGRMALGSTEDSQRGDTGGDLTHTHTQPTHTHNPASHTHTTPTHSHTVAGTGNGGIHTHTQGSTSSAPTHTHTSAVHQHNEGTLTVGTTTAEVSSGRHGSSLTEGLFAEVDLDNLSTSNAHTHTDGGLLVFEPVTSVNSGSSGSTNKTHYHIPTGNAYSHTHAGGTITGWTNITAGGDSGAGGGHSHTNPASIANATHSHNASADTGTAAPGANSGASGTTGADGDDVTGSATAPYLTMNALIRWE